MTPSNWTLRPSATGRFLYVILHKLYTTLTRMCCSYALHVGCFNTVNKTFNDFDIEKMESNINVHYSEDKSVYNN